MEAAQIVGAHDPDEAHAGTARGQIAHRVVGVARADVGFEAGDVDARMMGERARGREALRQRRKAAGVLERIARRHQPPDPVEPDPVHGEQAGGAVRRMRRIEGAAEQADLVGRGRAEEGEGALVSPAG